MEGEKIGIVSTDNAYEQLCVQRKGGGMEEFSLS